MNAKPTPEQAMQFMFDVLVSQRVDLTGPWQGWKVRGSNLVSPDGDRITPERLRGLAWRHALETRRDAARAKRAAHDGISRQVVTVLRIQNDDWHRERFGSLAG